ncbi:MAG TPA: phosphopantetheine-protein transferase, partial [Ktedonobacter sp.]|nr:phosphopantetheine-protein transferase [Ktedonobacter sp.]
SPREVAILRTVPSQLQYEAFFNCWTRKEAYIKARGMGLSLDLQLFDVSLAPGMPAALLGSREVGQDAARWSLYDLSPGLEYKAALAIAAHPLRLTFWQWPEPEA